MVICGPSSGPGLAPGWLDGENGEPRVPVTWAAIREQCAWVEKDEQARAAKTRRLLEMAVARARGSEPCAMTSIPIERTVAVAGANHAAFRMAAALLEAGFPVVMLQTGAADGCFYPISQELVARVTSHASVQVVADASIEHLEGHVGDFRLRVRGQGNAPSSGWARSWWPSTRRPARSTSTTFRVSRSTCWACGNMASVSPAESWTGRPCASCSTETASTGGAPARPR